VRSAKLTPGQSLRRFPSTRQTRGEVALFLIRSLDGTLDRAAILDRLWELLASKGALEYVPGQEESARRSLAVKLDENLETLAKLGLLVA